MVLQAFETAFGMELIKMGCIIAHVKLIPWEGFYWLGVGGYLLGEYPGPSCGTVWELTIHRAKALFSRDSFPPVYLLCIWSHFASRA